MKRHAIALVILAAMPTIAWACLWDFDTLRQERARFPSTLELITGKFLRHSKEFYEWRIQDRLKKLQADSKNVALYDDLAVAYDKTGQHEKAIETILKKEQIKPGLYETYSNLGTFYVLAGNFEKGLPFIDKALEINPDAHFGRERYQKWLIEYAESRKENGVLKFPLRKHGPKVDQHRSGFRAFLKQKVKGTDNEDMQQASKAVLGMMRFADHDNPLLLEALGDVLVDVHHPSDAKRLAARAYLKAAYQTEDESTQKAYRELAENALTSQTSDPYTTDLLRLRDVEEEFRIELADAERWYSELHQKELTWIRDGKDVDAEFDRLYVNDPTVIDTTPSPLRSRNFVIGLVCIAWLALLFTWVAIRLYRRIVRR